MKRFSLFLSIYLYICLLAACMASDTATATPDEEPTCGPGVPALVTCRVVEKAEQWGGTLILAEEDGGFGDVYTLDWEDNTIRAGDLVEITFSGSVQESFPMGLTGVTEVRVLEEDFDNLASLYLDVLEDLFEKDPALSENISIMGLDLSQTSLSDAERAAIGWYLPCLHGSIECVSGTLEAMIDWGYITGEPLDTADAPSDAIFWHWEDGCHFSIVEESLEDGVLTFDAQKWRSSLGAYFFSDCTALRSADGTWAKYTIGAEMIS